MKRAGIGLALLMALGCVGEERPKPLDCIGDGTGSHTRCAPGYVVACPDEEWECVDDQPEYVRHVAPLCLADGERPTCASGAKPECQLIEDVASRCGGEPVACVPDGEGAMRPVCPPGHEPVCFGPGTPRFGVSCGSNETSQIVRCAIQGFAACYSGEPNSTGRWPVICVPCD